MQIQRRDLLRFGLGAAAAAAAGGSATGALAALGGGRELTLRNLHTGESLTAAYWEAGRYVPDALAALNKVLRDHRTGEVHAMDPQLMDLLTSLAGKLETRPQFQVISGYRSPASNAKLHGKEFANILDDSGAKACFVTRDLASSVPSAARTLAI